MILCDHANFYDFSQANIRKKLTNYVEDDMNLNRIEYSFFYGPDTEQTRGEDNLG